MPAFTIRSRPGPVASVLLWAVLLVTGACTHARLPAEEARATPAARVAAESFAMLHDGGMPLGSAVAIAPGRIVTNAHVLRGRKPMDRLFVRRGDGAAEGEARLLAISDRMDLAVLSIPPGLFVPAPLAEGPPVPGTRVWAIGAPSAGPAIAAGPVEVPALHLHGYGPGFTTRIGALMGYSGGPVLDGDGVVLGLVTALPQANSAAPVLALLTGLDLDGLLQGTKGREVFALSIAAVRAEADQLAPWSRSFASR